MTRDAARAEEDPVTEPETAPRPSRLARLGRVLAGALVVAVLGSGAAAVAGTRGAGAGAGLPAVYTQDDGVVALNWDAVDDAWYRSEVIALDRVEDLVDDGKAMYGTHNIELACHGVVAVFDTLAEEQAYSAGFEARMQAVAEQQQALAPGPDPADADPCAWWKDPVPGLPGRT